MTRDPTPREPAASTVRVGPAGWSYKDWEGIVYPAPRPRGFDPLTYLAGYFDAVEVNSTFYGPAADAAARAWVARAVAGERARDRFRFTAKLWQRFTHQREAAFTPADVDAVRRGFDVLAAAGRLGAVLVQFPWSFTRDDANREWLDDVTRAFGRAEPGGAGYPLVLEVRHASWNIPAFYAALAERGIGFVNVDQPLFAKSLGPSATATAPVGYVRLHGRNYEDWWRPDAGVEARYDYLYTAAELEPWAARTRAVAAVAPETYVVTNNHYRGQAVTNAVMLDAMLAGRPVDAPPGVAATYAAALAPYVRA
ncbi:hypothetical protein tb265_06630 [Gemmatimonadetes bacterium T265]|nr:hypothetical protein tb265_06630 [Gemmatimonadetes bacterium T265]